jgi:hypothetical protein
MARFSQEIWAVYSAISPVIPGRHDVASPEWRIVR